MPIIKIRGHDVDVDVRGELEAFEWGRPRWSNDKLIAASPFRYDRSPSFFVNLDGEYAGAWADSGFYDEEWKSGGFVKLLAFLRNETYEEAEDYLLSEYSVDYGAELKMAPPNLRLDKPFRALPESTIEAGVSTYLSSRGISEEVQRMAGVGKSKHPGFTAIPWRQPSGRLANVKYRATRGKTFFYERGAWPIRKLVYGADLVWKKAVESVVLCEAEIDALSWWTVGQPAVAVGGVAFTDSQADIIKRLPTECIILGGDNDKAGRKFNEVAADKLKGYFRLKEADYGRYKDANESLQAGRLSEVTEIFDKISLNLSKKL